MDLQVKKLKGDFSTSSRQHSPQSLLSPPKAEGNYSFHPVKEEDYENLFQNVLF